MFVYYILFFSFYCSQINGDSSITNPLTEPLKLEVKTFAQDDFQTALPSTVRSGEIIYYQVWRLLRSYGIIF